MWFFLQNRSNKNIKLNSLNVVLKPGQAIKVRKEVYLKNYSLLKRDVNVGALKLISAKRYKEINNLKTINESNNGSASDNGSASGDENEADIDLESMSFKELKTLAKEKGLQFKGNISRDALMELIRKA